MKGMLAWGARRRPLQASQLPPSPRHPRAPAPVPRTARREHVQRIKTLKRISTRWKSAACGGRGHGAMDLCPPGRFTPPGRRDARAAHVAKCSLRPVRVQQWAGCSMPRAGHTALQRRADFVHGRRVKCSSSQRFRGRSLRYINSTARCFGNLGLCAFWAVGIVRGPAPPSGERRVGARRAIKRA